MILYAAVPVCVHTPLSVSACVTVCVHDCPGVCVSLPLFMEACKSARYFRISVYAEPKPSLSLLSPFLLSFTCRCEDYATYCCTLCCCTPSRQALSITTMVLQLQLLDIRHYSIVPDSPQWSSFCCLTAFSPYCYAFVKCIAGNTNRQ